LPSRRKAALRKGIYPARKTNQKNKSAYDLRYSSGRRMGSDRRGR
jgi:hypothetical protein